MDSEMPFKDEWVDTEGARCTVKCESEPPLASVPLQSTAMKGAVLGTSLNDDATQFWDNQYESSSSSHETFETAAESLGLDEAPSHQPVPNEEDHQLRNVHEQTQQKTLTNPNSTKDSEKDLLEDISRAVLRVLRNRQSASDDREKPQQIADLHLALHLETEARIQAEKELEIMKKDRDSWEHCASDFFNENAQLNEDLSLTIDNNSRCREQVETTQREKETLQTALEDAKAELARCQRSETLSAILKRSKVSDSTIKGEWKQLQYNIRNLVFSLGREPHRSELSESAGKTFRDIDPLFMNKIRNEEDRALLLQGYLWRLVSLHVFTSSQATWQNPTTKLFKAFRRNIFDVIRDDSKKMEEVAPWITAGWEILNRERPDPGLLQQFVAMEAKNLEPFFPCEERRIPRELRRVEDDLWQILKSALKLDDCLQNSRAIFQVWGKQKQGPTYFSDDVMETVACSVLPTRKTKVEFFVSPYLVKIGNADGHRYDASIVLAKAQVVCP